MPNKKYGAPDLTDADYEWAIRICVARARRVNDPKIDLDEVRQRARIAVWLAWERWDPSRNDSFQGFAITAVRFSVDEYVRELNGMKSPVARELARNGNAVTFVPLEHEDGAERAQIGAVDAGIEAIERAGVALAERDAALDAVDFIHAIADGRIRAPRAAARRVLQNLRRPLERVPVRRSEERWSAVSDARRWLREVLGDREMAAKDIERLAAADGLAWTTVRKACFQTVLMRKEGFQGRTFWRLKRPKLEPPKTPGTL